MPVRPTLLHRLASFLFYCFVKIWAKFGQNLLFRKTLLEFFGQIVYRPPWQKIARTPMRKSVEFWILFYRYNPRWSSAPKNNIYMCIFVWRQLLSVYNGGIHHRRQGSHTGEQEQKTKLFFHVNSLKNSFIVLFISMATFVVWLKKRAINTFLLF